MLTGLELMFMGVTQFNYGLFSTPGFIVSPVGKRERLWDEKRRKIINKRRQVEGTKKGKGWKEEGIKKEEGQKGRRNSGVKEERKKKNLLLALNQSG